MTNNRKVNKVMHGYTSLSNDERNMLIDEINNYNKQSYTEKTYINERLEKSIRLDLGPTGDNFCPCCGKG